MDAIVLPLSAGSSHGVAAWGGVCLLIMAGGSNRTWGEPGTKEAVDLAVASNQSVSLEEKPVRIQPESSESAVSGQWETQASTGLIGPELQPPPTQPIRTLARTRLPSRQEALESNSSQPWYRTSLGSLALVLGVVAALYWIARRWAPSAKAAEHGVLRVVARTSLTPKHGAALIQLGRRYILVGVSPTHVQTLCDVTDTEEVADLMIRTGSAKSNDGKRFDELLADRAEEFGDSILLGKERGRADGGVGESRPVADLLRRLKSVRI